MLTACEWAIFWLWAALAIPVIAEIPPTTAPSLRRDCFEILPSSSNRNEETVFLRAGRVNSFFGMRVVYAFLYIKFWSLDKS